MPIETLNENPAASAPAGYIYFMTMDDEDAPEDAPIYMKIGYATDPNNRRYQLQTGLPFNLSIEAVFAGNPEDEKALHQLLAKHRIRREWFRFNEELGEYLDDLNDAYVLLQVEHGEEYEPTIRECMAYKNPEKIFNAVFSNLTALQRASISEGP